MRLATGVAHGFIHAVVPVTAGLILGYGGITLAALRVANGVDQALTQQVRHEGEYLASITGTQWPGVVPDPSGNTQEARRG
jgi:hypothetical protein